MRTVVLLAGPPGAGKTSAARASGLEVYDRDDDCWESERDFTAALVELGQRHSARAVVIRAAPTSSARRRWAEMIRATHVFVIAEPIEVLEARVRARGRADISRSIPSIRSWYGKFDVLDDPQRFAGWQVLDDPGDLGLMT